MTRVLICPSAHGLGHLRRCEVLAEAIRRAGHHAILARDAGPRLDLGVRLWDAHERGSLHEAVAEAIARGPDEVAAWRRALRALAPDVVVADADPAPVAAARREGIGAIVVSNFTWADLVEHWAPGTSGGLAELYEGCDALSIPFGLGLRGCGAVVAVPHLANPIAPRESMPTPRVLLAMGRGNPPPLGPLRATAPATLLHAPDAMVPLLEGPIQSSVWSGAVGEAMAGCDLVITKGGYSTVAEAIAARLPMVLVPRDGPEDARMIDVLTRAGVARVVAPGDPIPLPAADALAAMRAAYATADPSWARCDPDEVARRVLEG